MKIGAEIDALIKDIPDHPYARLSKMDIRDSIDHFLAFMNEMGLPYKKQEDKNIEVITPIGTTKPTYAVPSSMWNGVIALSNCLPTLVVDIWGLKGFSALQITEMLKNRWPGLRSVRIPFPSVSLFSTSTPA